VYVHRRPPERVANRVGDAAFIVEAQMIIDPDEEAPPAILFAQRR
jgi:hypothetical protein